jgi:hypothetical protein
MVGDLDLNPVCAVRRRDNERAGPTPSTSGSRLGTGRCTWPPNGPPVTPTWPLGNVYGIDHSDVMLRQATKRDAAAIRAGQVTLTMDTVELLPPALDSRLNGAGPAAQGPAPTTDGRRTHRHLLPTVLPRGREEQLSRRRPRDCTPAAGRRLYTHVSRNPRRRLSRTRPCHQSPIWERIAAILEDHFGSPLGR